LLAKRKGGTKASPPEPEYVELLQSCELVIIDEHHHMEGDQWRRVIQDSMAPYKVGLSATVFLDHEKECELGVIWLHACAGDVLLDISVSDLVEEGYLVKPDIWICPIRDPVFPPNRGWSQRLQKQAIYENEHRNDRIVGFAKQLIQDGRRPVVISNRHSQVFALQDGLENAGLSVGRIIGQTKRLERESIVEAFRQRQIDVLLGTVFGEGVDIPEIDAVIVAEGGAGVKQTYQRLRCMTPHDTKESAVVVDFMDLTHPYFARHSVERLSVYESERAFSIKIVE
jgi:superfamily II DNA or RNA helicase